MGLKNVGRASQNNKYLLMNTCAILVGLNTG
jgi:hypothetical protein